MATGDLTTLANVRSYLRITDAAQTASDDLLSAFITQASRAIRKYTAVEFATTQTGSQTRLFAYYGNGRLFLQPHTLRSVTSVSIDTETSAPTQLVDGSDYFLFPRGGGADGIYHSLEIRGYEPLTNNTRASKAWREVSVTGTWGYPVVPDDVVLATNILVGFWQRNHSTIPGMSTMSEGDRFGPVMWPTAVLQILSQYRIIGFGYGA